MWKCNSDSHSNKVYFCLLSSSSSSIFIYPFDYFWILNWLRKLFISVQMVHFYVVKSNWVYDSVCICLLPFCTCNMLFHLLVIQCLTILPQYFMISLLTSRYSEHWCLDLWSRIPYVISLNFQKPFFLTFQLFYVISLLTTCKIDFPLQKILLFHILFVNLLTIYIFFKSQAVPQAKLTYWSIVPRLDTHIAYEKCQT